MASRRMRLKGVANVHPSNRKPLQDSYEPPPSSPVKRHPQSPGSPLKRHAPVPSPQPVSPFPVPQQQQPASGQPPQEPRPPAATKYRQLRRQFNQLEAEDREKLTILHFTFWNPPGTSSSTCSEETPAQTPWQPPAPTARQESSTTTPRVKVGPDGSLVVDEKSLLLDTSSSLRAAAAHAAMETVSGSSFEVGSSGLFRNKRRAQGGRRGRDWSLAETLHFYRALTACGTDFSMMASHFPKRSRHELKAKFKREDRKNAMQVSRALAVHEFDPGAGEDDGDEPQQPTPIPRVEPTPPPPPVEEPPAPLPPTSVFHRMERVAYCKDSPAPQEPSRRGRPPSIRIAPCLEGLEVASAMEREVLIEETNRTKSPGQRKTKPNKGRGQPPVTKGKTRSRPELPPLILRFDPGDPLGHKVVTGNLPASQEPHIVIDLPTSAAAAAPARRQTSRRRVPGGGGQQLAAPERQPLVDEIEIEIECG